MAQIVDDQISRKHAQIRCVAGRYVALDMRSANGTLVNGRPLTGEMQLSEGDEIAVGASTLIFSERIFPDRESALEHWRQRGERGRSTLQS
ncbi:MAG: hypothetical protein AMXMBFR22_32290 [Phycisphaerae bacterium]|jgi:pSer/pThr/pTyr-binding forkhead associated (FHA) protein